MKSLLISLVILLGLFVLPCQATDTDVFGDEAASRTIMVAVLKDFPPLYGLDDKGRPQGFAIDIIRQVAKEAGLELCFLLTENWAQAMDAVRKGDADLIPGIGISDARSEEFLFSEVIETVPVSCFVRTTNRKISGLDDLPEYRVAVITQSAAMTRLLCQPRVNLSPYPNIDTALFSLLSGAVDAFVFPEPVLWKKARQIGVEDRIRVVGQPLMELKRGFLMRASDTELLERLNPVIKAFRQSDDYAKSYLKWHGKPTPFWTVQRILLACVISVAIFVLNLFLWHYVSIKKLNSKLVQTIRQREEAEAQIRYQAFYDSLTDLPNRWLFRDRLTFLVAKARRHNFIGAVLFIDLDHFKTINDSLGHPVGDTLLSEVARRLSKALRREDVAARLGGDEFVILLSNLGSDAEVAAARAQKVAQKIQECISEPMMLQAHEICVTASIGLSLFPGEMEDADDLLRCADTAMYRAKEGGRNAIQFFKPKMQQMAEARLHLQNDLRRAVDRDEFQLYFQPQLNTEGEVVGVEALLRWDHPERGFVPPDEFIPVAEDTGLILPIGDWVLQQACRIFHQIKQDYPSGGLNRLAVNVSPLQFHHAHFVEQVERAVADSGIAPQCLELELTEGMLVENFEGVSQKMQALKKLGVRLSIDDFGTGYSSLSYLKRLPLDMLKIDRTFVRDIAVDPNDKAIVQAIIAMAQHLGLDLLAEGVEDEGQLSFLKAQGCFWFQGFYFGRPMPVAQLQSFLSTG